MHKFKNKLTTSKFLTCANLQMIKKNLNNIIINYLKYYN